jgi:uroporphyrinogen decarboxylase
LLQGSGVDGYLEIDLHAGMELKKLKDGYGERITFLGNMDCGNTLSFSSPEDIRHETVKCLEDGLGNGGHIFTASNAITDSVPIENYYAMVNAYKDFWKQPRLEI